jgi:hypothetical protein
MRKLGSQEYRRGRFTCPWNAVIASRENAKAVFDVRVRHLVHFVLGDLQKGLPYAESCVVERYADVGCRPGCAHGADGGLDFFVVVVGYRERGCLCCCSG